MLTLLVFVTLYFSNSAVCSQFLPLWASQAIENNDSLEWRPTVKTNLGNIRGIYRKSFSGRKYAAYEGIPYALPPTLERRFEPPEPVKAWKGTLLATKPSPICIQYVHQPTDHPYPIIGEEDCLYLNIYVPNCDHFLPVLFSIHGGAFQFGSGTTGAKYLMDRDVILVSFNYRLGPFGFLSTEDDVIHGNMGLKDQSLALQWVSKNIHNFGGDPHKITLIGISAGAASVHYHYLSAMSKGLFQNGISFSGSVFGPGKRTENSREKAKKLASILGCPTENIRIMIECLRTKPAKFISQSTKYFMPFLYNPITPFGPVVEKYCHKPFIDRSPIEIIRSGDVADVLWVTSIVSEEGLYPAAEFINNAKHLNDLDKKWIKIAPHLLDFNFTVPLEKHAEVAMAIRQHYLGMQAINKDTIYPIIRMIGDRLYTVDVEKAARLQAKVNKSPIYFWYYSYRALTSISNFYSKSFQNFGVSHGDNYYMIFENPIIDPSRTLEDRAMQLKLIDLVVTVAEKGYPDLNLEFKWKKVDPNKKKLEFLHIASSNNITMVDNDNLGEKYFWSMINFDENRLTKSVYTIKTRK